MSAGLAIALSLLAASEPVSMSGTVRVSSQAGGPAVSLVVSDTEAVSLRGDLVAEVARLQSAKVELVGLRDGEALVVRAYTILDLGGGARPTLVGKLSSPGEGALAIASDDGTPVPLSMSPKLKNKLAPLVGGKVWVVGHKLLSGELKVTRFGILSEPRPAADDSAPAVRQQGEP